jgi:hypothetical protein
MRGNRIYLACRGTTIMAGFADAYAGGIMSPGTASEGCGGVTG